MSVLCLVVLEVVEGIVGERVTTAFNHLKSGLIAGFGQTLLNVVDLGIEELVNFLLRVLLAR